jgi:hypothetical protein
LGLLGAFLDGPFASPALQRLEEGTWCFPAVTTASRIDFIPWLTGWYRKTERASEIFGNPF